MNKRDWSARFRVEERAKDGGIEIYFSYGWQIEDKARLRWILMGNEQRRLGRVSLRRSLQIIATHRDLKSISAARCYVHVIDITFDGVRREHDAIADPMIVRPKEVQP